MSPTIPLRLSSSSPEYKGISQLNIIYEAGLDNESRPILVLCANNLPNPDTINYDLILAFILSRLDEFVENDYVLIFFSSPAQYRPSWLWLLKAYRALDRRYKKNLKALYVVHLSRSYRMIFDLANKITSPKFARKLQYLQCLSDLNQLIQVPTNMIPQPVVDYDASIPAFPTTFKFNSITPMPTVSLAFGRSLKDLASMEGWTLTSDPPVPRVVYQLIHHLRTKGLNKEGIFRKSPSSEELRIVKTKFNYGETVDLNDHDVDVSAALLKVFLRELPTSIISVEQSAELGELLSGKEEEKKSQDGLRQKVQATFAHKPYALALLRYLCEFLSEVVQHSKFNKMTAHNLAVVFTPNLVRVDEPPNHQHANIPTSQQEAMASASLYLKQMNQGISLVEILISRYDSLL
ncbi:Rho GTPase activation protein [Halteromyces radiatus]|uniref:Rho GTPase activation protein n=1 Tax=Halteromyces radiatus TaxID=101107 RepID=UPI0022203520|nr:Rho GTPase activation protein [Halteromyces radiatus]KAI8084739.1 Rho GTPase activation protein [Halteromyces radiatus]